MFKRTIALLTLCALFTSSFSCSRGSRTLSATKRRPGEVIRQIPTRQKYIALTFDDGPSPKYTPRILSVLAKYRASATFFLLGQHIERYPEVAAQIVNSGHEVGVHAYSHAFLNRLGPNQVKVQINRTYNLIYQATGCKPVLFRPPYGFYNRETLAAAREKRLQVILWTPSGDPKDYENPGIDVIVSRIVKSAKPGTIVLLHDYGGNRSQTVRAVDKVITKLKAKGFKFVTISKALQINTRSNGQN
ncbi:MAG: polysaccharide deacetylase family protein [Eubacteriales bacterium]